MEIVNKYNDEHRGAADGKPRPSTDDIVPFINGKGGVWVSVIVGGRNLPMIIDTGANISSIPAALANRLIAEGHASELDGGNVQLADGSMHYQRAVRVDALTLGSHTRRNVRMTVSNGTPLLALPILNAIGKFSIDPGRSVLTFNENNPQRHAGPPRPPKEAMARPRVGGSALAGGAPGEQDTLNALLAGASAHTLNEAILVLSEDLCHYPEKMVFGGIWDQVRDGLDANDVDDTRGAAISAQLGRMADHDSRVRTDVCVRALDLVNETNAKNRRFWPRRKDSQ